MVHQKCGYYLEEHPLPHLPNEVRRLKVDSVGPFETRRHASSEIKRHTYTVLLVLASIAAISCRHTEALAWYAVIIPVDLHARMKHMGLSHFAVYAFTKMCQTDEEVLCATPFYIRSSQDWLVLNNSSAITSTERIDHELFVGCMALTPGPFYFTFKVCKNQKVDNCRH